MGKDNSMYLTDRQYLDLMIKIRKDLDGMKSVWVEDSTTMGNKHTATNVGLCAATTEKGWAKDKYTTRETAMWPEEFDKQGKSKYEYPQQFTMKYRGDYHDCPLDIRLKPKKFLSSGCFYRCIAFKDKTLTIQEVKRLYDQKIKEWQDRLAKRAEGPTREVIR